MRRRLLPTLVTLGFVMLAVAVLVTALTASTVSGVGGGGGPALVAASRTHAATSVRLERLAQGSGVPSLTSLAKRHATADSLIVRRAERALLDPEPGTAREAFLALDNRVVATASRLRSEPPGDPFDRRLLELLVTHIAGYGQVAALPPGNETGPTLVRVTNESVALHAADLATLEAIGQKRFGRRAAPGPVPDPHAGMAGM